MKEEVKLNAGVNTEEDFPDARIMIGWTVASCAAGIQPAIRMMTTILSAQTVDQVISWTSRQTDVFASLAKKQINLAAGWTGQPGLSIPGLIYS